MFLRGQVWSSLIKMRFLTAVEHILHPPHIKIVAEIFIAVVSRHGLTALIHFPFPQHRVEEADVVGGQL